MTSEKPRRRWLGLWGWYDGGMKWPQFELWRLFAATACFSSAFGLFRAGYQVNEPFDSLLDGLAVIFLGAAFGTPFRRGRAGAFGGFMFVVLGMIVTAIMLALFARGP